MKKTVSFFLSFVLLLSAVFCVPGFSASAAVYKPDRKLYSQAYMLLSLDDPSLWWRRKIRTSGCTRLL